MLAQITHFDISSLQACTKHFWSKFALRVLLPLDSQVPRSGEHRQPGAGDRERPDVEPWRGHGGGRRALPNIPDAAGCAGRRDPLASRRRDPLASRRRDPLTIGRRHDPFAPTANAVGATTADSIGNALFLLDNASSICTAHASPTGGSQRIASEAGASDTIAAKAGGARDPKRVHRVDSHTRRRRAQAQGRGSHEVEV